MHSFDELQQSPRSESCRSALLKTRAVRGLHHGRWLERQQRWVVVPPGRQRHSLKSLPLKSLQLPVGVIDSLAEVGVDSVEQLLRLPNQQLPYCLLQFLQVVCCADSRIRSQVASSLESERSPKKRIYGNYFVTSYGGFVCLT